MFNLLLLFILSLSPIQDNQDIILSEDDAGKRICIWIFGKRTICVGVESTFKIDDIKLEGQVKFDRNLMVVSGFPKDLNGQSFQITEIASFDHPERKGVKFDIYPSKVSIERGQAIIPIRQSK